MFAVLNHAIQHFPAQNLSYYINGDFDFYTDSGEKIAREDLDKKAEEEIKEHTIGDADTAIQAYKNGENNCGVIPYRIYGIGDVNDSPLNKTLGGEE